MENPRPSENARVPDIPRIEKDVGRKARRGNSPRVAVLGVLRDAEGRVLVAAFRDGFSGALLHRPPGGGVRFGERVRDALVREFEEELAGGSRMGRQLGVFEDLFLHEGKPGHEIVFVFDAEFQDKSLHGSRDLTLVDAGVSMPLGWHPADSFAPRGSLALCPPGLAELLQGTL